jgi:hypothetical protein
MRCKNRREEMVRDLGMPFPSGLAIIYTVLHCWITRWGMFDQLNDYRVVKVTVTRSKRLKYGMLTRSVHTHYSVFHYDQSCYLLG